MAPLQRLCTAFVLLCITYATAESSFLGVGDWGGIASGSKYHEASQRAVAAGMAAAAAAAPQLFVVGVGDNFYDYGVSAAEDPSEFTVNWAQVYNASSLRDLKWIQALGNHDYGLDPQAQVTYASTHPNWVMPPRYYSQRECLVAAADGGCGDESGEVVDDGKHATFIVLDTNPCVSSYRSSDPAGWDPKPNKPGQPAGYAFHENILAQDCGAQLAWLKKAVAAVPKHDWLIGVGHHLADEIDVEDLMAVLVAGGMDFYMNGHQHHLGYYHIDGGGNYVTTGAGCIPHLPTAATAEMLAQHQHPKLATNGHNITVEFHDHIPGFTSHTFSDDLLSVHTRWITYNGTERHGRTFTKVPAP